MPEMQGSVRFLKGDLVILKPILEFSFTVVSAS
jgi:hypothetical protein